MRGITRKTGATARQVRHWERLGLLGPVERTPGGWRIYEGAQVHLAWDINDMRQRGFSIEEIRALTGSVSAEELEALAREEEAAARAAARRAGRLRREASRRRPASA